MEPFSAIAIVIGLAGSLTGTCKVLEEIASRFTTDRFGSNFRDAVTTLLSSHGDLIAVQNSLRTKGMHAQLEKLSSSLNDIEDRLRVLEEGVQDMDKYRTKFLFRWQGRGLWTRDIELAKSSILLAMNMVKMMKVVQCRFQGDTLHIEHAGDTSTGGDEINRRHMTDMSTIPHGLIFSTDDIARIWRINHPPSLLTEPDTMTDQIFARIAAPEPQDKFHARCRAVRVAGTCQWFLDTDEFQSWRQRKRSTGDRGIFWCQGKPGIGKTILVSKIIDDLRVSESVAYFYMSSGRLHSASDLVASLLKQLCLPFHFVPRRLRQVYDQSEDQRHLPLELDDLLQALKETSQGIHQPITIVVDGLDEVNMNERKHFVKVLASLKETSCNWLFTSRPNQPNQVVIRGALDGYSEFSIEELHLGDDVRNFVDSALAGDKPVHTMLRDEALRCDVLETLTSRAQGMFYWAALQIRLILDQTDPSGIRRALDKTPSNVSEIVQIAMEMMRQQTQAREQLARSALAFLTFVVTPITAGALCHALGMANVLDSGESPSELRKDDIPNPDSIVECCQGLVAIDPETSVVTIAYCDIEEYMQKHWATIFPPHVKIKLVEVLLAYLLMDTFLSGLCDHVDEFSSRLDHYPLVAYASRYWGHHVHEALSLGMPEQRIIECVNDFLAKRSNLESSLQVSSIISLPPRAQQELLRSTQEDFALYAKKVKSRSTLQVAACHGLHWVVRECIDRFPDTVSYQDLFGRSALHEAAGAGWVDLVNMLLTAGARPLIQDEDGKSPLYHAAKAGHMSIKAILLKYGSNSGSPVEGDTHDRDGGNTSGSYESPESLQEKRSLHEFSSGRDEPNVSELEVAFYDAAAAGNVDVVQQLLNDRENIELEKHGTKALLVAIEREQEEVLEILLREGANPLCPNGSPAVRIPLHQAIKRGNVRMASRLLDFGANLQTRDSHKRTALFEALHSSNADGAALLLYHGINISATDHLGDTVLHKAVEGGSLEHALLLINQGMEVDARNNDGVTPLHLATKKGHYHLFRLLLRSGADVNAVTFHTKETPLMYAVSADSIELCQMLLRRGADVNAISSDKKTPLMLAAAAGNVQLVEDLLSHGANPNLSKYELMLAAAAGNVQLVKDLLSHGANPNLSKYEPIKSRGLAAKLRQQRILSLLLEPAASSEAEKQA